MGVEQKPLYVTQVDKLEAKIQVNTLERHRPPQTWHLMFPQIFSSPQALCHASLVGRQSSYSPYSQVWWYLAFHRIKLRKLLQEYVIFQFSVGAALLCADGTTVLGELQTATCSDKFLRHAPKSKIWFSCEGCNVENASYGLAICAERTAAVKVESCHLLSNCLESPNQRLL